LAYRFGKLGISFRAFGAFRKILWITTCFYWDKGILSASIHRHKGFLALFPRD